MDIRKLQRAIVDGLEDVKAQNIAVFNTEHLSPLFERVIIASGTSNRQTKALASSVRETVKKRGMDVLRTEGEDNGEWIIVDCGAAVAHIMQPSIREYYNLEEIWGGKSVPMKIGKAQRGLPKAAEPAPPARKTKAAKPPLKKPAAAKTPAKRAPARKAAPATAKPARPPAAKKAPLKTAVASKSVVRTSAVKQPLVKQPVARKAEAKRPAARQAPAKKTAARTTPARKAPPKKPAARRA